MRSSALAADRQLDGEGETELRMRSSVAASACRGEGRICESEDAIPVSDRDLNRDGECTWGVGGSGMLEFSANKSVHVSWAFVSWFVGIGVFMGTLKRASPLMLFVCC